ncbi:MAG: hypothetical protein WD850_03180 [Candidatus Spechtbacterales bacterium]
MWYLVYATEIPAAIGWKRITGVAALDLGDSTAIEQARRRAQVQWEDIAGRDRHASDPRIGFLEPLGA